VSVLPSTPADLGFNPSKFPAWRSVQIRNADEVLNSLTRVTASCMPVGTGKSLDEVAIAKLLNQPAVILTATNNLLKQLNDDFPDLPVIKGRANYECEGGYGSCDEGANAKCEHRGGPSCPYAHAKAEFNSAQIGITNYAYWLAAGKNEGLTRRKLVIMDEAHDAADIVCSALTVNVTDKDVKLIGVSAPPMAREIDSFPAWGAWAKAAYPVAKAKVAVLEKQAEGDRHAVKALIRGRRLLSGLALLSQAHDLGEEWAVDGGDRSGRGREDSAYWYTITPVRPGRYTELTLLRGAEQVLIYSGTITPHGVVSSGIRDFTFLDYDSPFPLSSMPIYFVPTVQLSSKSTPEAKRTWVGRIDEIIDGRTDRKGIIHTVAYARAEEIADMSRHSHRMITHGPGAAQTEEAIRLYCGSDKPCILVSPSVHTGYNFPMHQAEYQIVAKLPWPDTRSNLMQMRMGLNQPAYSNARIEGEAYRGYLIASTIAQMAGRGMRSEKDRCETFIIDSSMSFFMRGNQRHFPKAFRRAYKKVDRVPEPPKPSLLDLHRARIAGTVARP